MKRPQIKIVEIDIHRSKRNPKIGHAVALLFPCCHHKYLGITLYKGDDSSNRYKAQDCRIIKFEDYAILDKENCKLCPMDDYWLDDLHESVTLDEFSQLVEVLDID